MSKELILFSAAASVFALFQTAAALPVLWTTMYQLTDRPSWLLGGGLAVGIALWRPWFTTTWWKALIAAPLLVIFMASMSQLFIERVLTLHQAESRVVMAARLTTSVLVLAVLFFGFRACG